MRWLCLLFLLLTSCQIAIALDGDAGVITVSVVQTEAGVDVSADAAPDVEIDAGVDAEPDAATPPTLATTAPVPEVTDTHDAFGVVMRAGSDLVSVRRRGLTHAQDRGVIVQSRSTDNGATWSTPAVLFEDPVLDSRNVAGGARANGELVIWYNTYNYEPPYGSEWVYRSHSIDGGLTWSTPVAEPSTWYAYGPLIEANGSYGVVATVNGIPSVVMRDDLGVRTVRAIAPGPTSYETAIVAIDALHWVGFGREIWQNTPLSLVETFDAGLTWTTTPATIPNTPPPAGSTVVSWNQVSPWVHRSSAGWITLVLAERASYTPIQNAGYLRAITVHETEISATLPPSVEVWRGDYLDFGYPSTTLGDVFALQFYSGLTGLPRVDTFTAIGWLE